MSPIRYEAFSMDEVQWAQQQWINAVCAADVEWLLSLYDLTETHGPLLFKPTLSTKIRTDREGVRSYFVGGDPRYPGDTGFLSKGWNRVQFSSAVGPVFEAGGRACNDMGQYVFETADNQRTEADYTFSYHKLNGRVLITLHHSSLIWQP